MSVALRWTNPGVNEENSVLKCQVVMSQTGFESLFGHLLAGI